VLRAGQHIFLLVGIYNELYHGKDSEIAAGKKHLNPVSPGFPKFIFTILAFHFSTKYFYPLEIMYLERCSILHWMAS
jgi:hypothetical protein